MPNDNAAPRLKVPSPSVTFRMGMERGVGSLVKQEVLTREAEEMDFGDV